MTSKFSAFFSVSALIVGIALSVPAMARDNAAPGGGVTRDQLILQGYTCEVAPEGHEVCTRPGGKTYTCTGQTCQEAPARTNSRNRLPNVNLNNQILTR